MSIVYQRRLHKSCTTQCTIKFLMFRISTCLRFEWAHAKSQTPRRNHAQWCIDVFVNPVIISVIYKFLSYSSPKHHNIMITSNHYHIVIMVIKSPRYTGGDFMFLYRFVRRRRRRRCRPQILVHAITFEQLFGFLSFLARLLLLIYRLTD